MTSKPKLLVVTHVDWDHAWQRPQALATALSEWFDVTVVSPVARRRAQLAANPREGIELRRVLRVPGSLRSAATYRLNRAMVAGQVAALTLGRRFDQVIATAPECGGWIAGMSGVPIAYDCMDDALAFEQDEAVRRERARDERALIARARQVLVSADSLAGIAVSRGARPSAVAIVPNGYDPSAFPTDASTSVPADISLRLGYFGSIAPWLDFDLLVALLERDAAMTLDMIGPIDPSTHPSHPRLRLHPPLRNDALRSAVSSCNVMVLPFRDTPLTRAVDPVKLYEYVALGKPILCRTLPSLERFAAFTTLYATKEEALAIVASRAFTLPPDPLARRRFLADASWAARASRVRDVLGARPA